MKNTLLIAALAFLGLISCNKIEGVDAPTSSKQEEFVKLDLSVNSTKAIKEAWTTGDYIYLFFQQDGAVEGIQKVVVRYDGSSWSVNDSASQGELNTISASGKVLGIYTAGALRTINNEEGVLNLGTDAFGETQTGTASYTLSNNIISASLPLAQAGLQISIKNISASDSWSLTTGRDPASRRIDGIGGINVSFGAEGTPELGFTPSNGKVNSVNNLGEVAFYVLDASTNASEAVNFVLWNNRTSRIYKKDLASATLTKGNAYFVNGPELDEAGNITTANSWSGNAIHNLALEYAKLLDVWTATVGTCNYLMVPSAIGAKGDEFDVVNAHYLPGNTQISLNGTTYNLADIFELGARCYLLLRGYDGNDISGGLETIPDLVGSYTMADAIPATHSYKWGTAPYNETKSNGGELRTSDNREIVRIDLLDNFTKRAVNFKKGNPISNLSSYVDKIKGYKGCCSSMRGILLYAEFFKYMLENHLYDARSIDPSVEFTSRLFK